MTLIISALLAVLLVGALRNWHHQHLAMYAAVLTGIQVGQGAWLTAVEVGLLTVALWNAESVVRAWLRFSAWWRALRRMSIDWTGFAATRGRFYRAADLEHLEQGSFIVWDQWGQHSPPPPLTVAEVVSDLYRLAQGIGRRLRS